MRSYFDTYEEFFVENLPLLFGHFKQQNLTPDLYIIDWCVCKRLYKWSVIIVTLLFQMMYICGLYYCAKLPDTAV